MTADYSEQISFALNYARKYYAWAFRVWPEDARQTAILGALSATESTYRCVAREVGRAMYGLIVELRGQVERSPGDILRRRSARSSRMWTAQRMRACGIDTAAVAEATGLGVRTVNRYTHTSRTPEEVSRLRSEGGKKGGKLGAVARWGNEYAERQIKARAMRSAGCTLREIQEACGYRSLSAAHYAAKSEAK